MRAWKCKSFCIKSFYLYVYTERSYKSLDRLGKLQINYHLERQNCFIILSDTLVVVLDICCLV